MSDDIPETISRRSVLAGVAGLAAAFGAGVATGSHASPEWTQPGQVHRERGDQPVTEASPSNYEYHTADVASVPGLLNGELEYESMSDWFILPTSDVYGRVLMELDRRWGGGVTSVTAFSPDLEELSTRFITSGVVTPAGNVPVSGYDYIYVQVVSLVGITGRYRLWVWEEGEKPDQG